MNRPEIRMRVRRWATLLVIGYVALGLLWILFSDRAVTILLPPVAQPMAQTYKGFAYVIMTGLLLFLLLDRLHREIVTAEHVRNQMSMRFMALFESPIVGLLMWGEGGKILECNKALVELLGRPIDDSVAWPELTTPESAEKLRAINIGTQEHGFAGPIGIDMLKRDGTAVAALVGLVRFPDEPTGGVAFVIDDRDRQAAIKDFERLNAELELRVSERTSELAYANEELRSFAYTISHDLRSPLRTIDGLVARVEGEDGVSVASREALARIHAAVERTSGIIDHVLKLASVSRAEIVRMDVDVSAAMTALAGELHVRPGYEKVEFAIEPAMWVKGDPTLLNVAFQNLLENAFKFSSTQESPKVSVSLKKGAIVIQDNGVGFDPDGTAQLFEAFRRQHGDEFPGSGVGLATVDRIIRRHGGKIVATSKPGKGATFTVKLP